VTNTKITITETYSYEIEVNAKTKAEGIAKAREIYDTVPDGLTFTADANSYVKTAFKVKCE